MGDDLVIEMFPEMFEEKQFKINSNVLIVAVFGHPLAPRRCDNVDVGDGRLAGQLPADCQGRAGAGLDIWRSG